MTDCVPCRRTIGSGFGQFVVSPSQACQLATTKANVLAVRVLAGQAARVLLLLGRPPTLLAEQLRAVGQNLAVLAQKSRDVADDAEPALAWSDKELFDICAAIGVAERASESATEADIVAERQQLLRVADTIQNAFQGQSVDLSPTPIAPGKRGPTSALTIVAIAAGAAAVAVGATWYFTRSR